MQQNARWNDDRIQFARLINELEHADAITPTVMKTLQQEMDLEESEITELLDRAGNAFDASKATLP